MKKYTKQAFDACILLFLLAKLLFFRLIKRIHIIGISGGPGGGKTIFIDYVTDMLTTAGHRVYRVPEAASILINAGEIPGSVAFQIKVFIKILELEWAAITLALKDNFTGHIFILCDRTLLDGNGYITDEEFSTVIKKFKMTIQSICKRYSVILYLETAAKNAPGFFGKETNEARYENEVEAKETCDRTFTACSKHPHFIHIFNDGGTFSQKLFKAYQQLCKVCSLPVPLKDTSAKRFYLHVFDSKMFQHINANVTQISIVQYYLKNKTGAQKPPRLRSKRYKDTEIFFYTRERQTGPDEYTQVEQIISIDELDALLVDVDPATKKIKKERYSYFSDGNLYEIDVFNREIFHKSFPGNAILKITPTKQKANITMPSQFQPLVLKELEAKELTDYMIACQ